LVDFDWGALQRTNFNSSRLVRFLADLSIMDAVEPKHAFAERLGQWLEIADAITLHAAHGATSQPIAASAERSVALPADRLAVEQEFARLRTSLIDSITASCSPDAGETRMKLPTPQTGTALETAGTVNLAAAYEPYHRYYLAHQGHMEASIRPLRGTLRQALGQAGPALQRLALLDAALDKILQARERQLLASVPLLLEKRFAQLANAHRQRLDENRQPDDPALRMQPGGWLADFCNELKSVLLAELDLRLQPTLGLIEALSNEAA
jgi:hypothetical protein